MDKPIGELLEIELKNPKKIMGFDTASLLDEEEDARIRLDILREQIRYNNKKGDR